MDSMEVTSMIVIVKLSARRYMAIDVPTEPTAWRGFRGNLGCDYTGPSWQTAPMSFSKMMLRVEAHLGERAIPFEQSATKKV